MKKNSLFLLPIIIMLIVVSYSAISQNNTKKTDFILLNDKSEIEAIVVEINEDDIKYRKANNMSGPLYSIKKSNVYMIIYSNGEREKFENINPPSTDKLRNNSVLPFPSSEVNIQNSSKQKFSVNAINAETITTDTESVDEGLSKETALADIGIDVTNQIGLSIPPIIFNAYNNKFLNKISKYLFIGVNNTYIISEEYTNIGLSFGGRYYLNGIMKLNPQKIMIYGGATVFDTGWSSIQDSYYFNFEITGRVGGTVYLSKKTGLFSEFAFVNGGSTFMVGLNIKYQ